jgi:choline dehydrogenase
MFANSMSANADLTAPVDTVVVGAGSAGCVVAARLAADPRHRVTLVEAGPDFGPIDSGRWPAALLDATCDAMDSHGWGFPGGISATRGKVVGGCSAINGCGILAGLDQDYDAWSEHAPGWSTAALAPYLERAEIAIGAHVCDIEDLDPWRRRFYDGALELGAAVRPRFDRGGAGDGIGPIAMNVVGNMRFNAAFAYLDSVRRCPNLEIAADALADRVVFDGRRALGIEVIAPGGRRTIRARRVVICAGAYASPALLVRSGIGPPRLLADLGIELVSPLPGVAEGLRDHPLVDVPLLASTALRERSSEHARRAPAIAQVLLRQGRPSIPWELQLGPWSTDLLGEDGELVPFGYCGITATLATPQSLGRVVISSRDPAVLPAVEHGFLTDRAGEDVARLAAGVALARELAATASISQVARLVPENAALEGAALNAWISSEVEGNFHPVGTCRMGTPRDPLAVVDGVGRVIGVDGLRVIDASILPGLPRANTHLTVLAVAERLAEDLQRDDGPG